MQALWMADSIRWMKESGIMDEPAEEHAQAFLE